MFSWLSQYRDFGLLLLRLGLGFCFFWIHGWPKLASGVAKWKQIGINMKYIGVDFLPEFWGFMAAFAEAGGGILLILGFFFRPACFMLTFTMLVATMTLWSTGNSLLSISHPIEMGIVFLSLLFIGPGRFSIDRN